LASKRQDSSFAATAGDDSKTIVPTVLGSNQCNFTILSPDSHLREPSISEHIG
jgi:hypothetical protein